MDIPELSAEQKVSLNKLIHNPNDWCSSASGGSLHSAAIATTFNQEYDSEIDEDITEDEPEEYDDSTDGRLSTHSNLAFSHEEMTSESNLTEEAKNGGQKTQEEIEDELFEIEERRLKKIYEENIDGVITEIEKGNFFLGFDKIPEADKYLMDKKVMKKLKLCSEAYMESWAKDVFVLQHNTIKAEMLNMYKIVASMEKRGLSLLKETMEQFYEWWGEFTMYFSFFMDVEEEILFPWIERRVDLSVTGLNFERRALIKSKVINLINEVTSHEAKVCYMPPGEVAPKMLGYMNQLCPMLLSYMTHCISNVVPSVANAYSPEDYHIELLPAIIRFYKVNPEWTSIAPLVTTWMNKQEIVTWKKQFLNTKEKFSFNMWSRGLRRGHFELQAAIIEERRVRMTLYRTWSK
eukprot:Plantae.Rhodophyta-Purpureofilum_apyrenoidigerum.ctg35884.p1 GENE.Plantae.Rhodophyta-Purpureofilum_apyrenoidigerum.ctg35884~~Plantae.Rhodophyta-Purpureofilum_apyrenoidigerum.ctg35884.p1  ORF type:complete len:406 (-),score=99.93 Plantae.Rhodophyta-Purpureofilum_apyrenoidigerum.ctg35884:582-1799(-)